MKRKRIDIKDIMVDPFELLSKDWMLLTSGDLSKNDFNCMTIGWGSMGTMWNKPFVSVVVRPTRHTFRFMEKYGTFTLCSFPAELKDKLQYLGSQSGRNTDKIKGSGLTPEKSTSVDAPCYKEADLVIECTKIYFDDFKPSNFIADYIGPLYKDDYHRIYFGEVIAISATDKYLKK